MQQNEPAENTGRITGWLNRAPNGVFMTYAVLCSFLAYFSMYAFRKPFTAATFEGDVWFGSEVGIKAVLASSQIIGYALSKVIGIKVCAELKPSQRTAFLTGIILIAEISLLVFGAMPDNWKFLPIAINGLSLGVVWGVVVSYLEGRRTSEVLLAGLSCSYIMASGIVKDFGLAVLAGDGAAWWHGVPFISQAAVKATGPVSEGWMPFIVGLHYLPIFLGAIYLLKQIPQPSQEDVITRSKRASMDGKSRKRFFSRFAFGMIVLCTIYLLLTAYRDYRDTYLVDLYSALGYDKTSGTQNLLGNSETIVGFTVTAGLAMLYWLRKWLLQSGLLLVWLFMASGLVALGTGTWLFQAGSISGFSWMVISGVGIYITYVPFGSVLFDEIIAETHHVGTAVFAIYVCDSVGYGGTVALYFLRDTLFGNIDKLAFFTAFTWIITAVGLVCLVLSYFYFQRKANLAIAPDVSE
ncbi:hypothetical protein NT6N_10500 [Oceaniferula spumae]|uniref:MFS transporter n=1 Tax=Oceaniferula spumae TaxID=2979115 RepID=A0AAT9FJ25_9BACT